MITYKQATADDADTIVTFSKMLFSSDNTVQNLRAGAEEHLRSDKWTDFLAFEDDVPVGFCEISLRNDYVEGTKGGTVGYAEGVYVLPEYRGRHIAKKA